MSETAATDLQLLARYTQDRAEDAFAELVRRHVDLVHSAALRQVRSPQLAEEVAQSVFADLARAGTKLKPDTILAAWLYQATRRTAIEVVRREARRQLREQIATEMNALNASGTGCQPVWSDLEPLLDEAMSALDETDRAAVLLRYFENQSLRDVGRQLGMSDDAAQKRVSRSVERLREFFAKHGFSIGAGGLASVLSANAVHAAPAGLAVTISTTAALAGTTVATTATGTAAKAIAMTTLQKTLAVATFAVLAGVGMYETRQASQLRDQVLTFQQQQAPLTAQVVQLERERDDATKRLASLAEELTKTKSNNTELLKLRGEVGRLRKELQSDEMNGAAHVVGNIQRLKHYLDQSSNAKTAELQFLSKEEWVNTASSSMINVGGEDQEKAYRRAASRLRGNADRVVGWMFRDAIIKYKESNNGQFPTDLGQLEPYFERRKDRPESGVAIENVDAIFQRWEIVPATQVKGMIAGGDWVITQKAPVDEIFDDRVVVGTYLLHRGFAITDTWDALEAVRAAYSGAHQGLHADDSAQLQPYATTPEQKAALQRLLQSEKWEH